jgi:hypothetical protein
MIGAPYDMKDLILSEENWRIIILSEDVNNPVFVIGLGS